MRAKLGSRFIVLLVGGLLATTATDSRADFAQCTNPATGGMTACSATSTGCCTGTFASAGGHNPLIIAMDRCHQPVGTGSLGPPLSGAPRKEFDVTAWTISGSSLTATLSAVTVGATLPGSGDYIKIAGSTMANANGTFKVVTCNSCGANQVKFTLTDSTGVSACGASCATAFTYNLSNDWCADPPDGSARIGGAASDNGMMRAYGLVYRLMQRAIPIYWLVNPSKSTPALSTTENQNQSMLASDVDVWVLTSDVTSPPTAAGALTSCLTTSTPACVQPVHRLKSADLSLYSDSYRYKQFPVRGGAFLIAAENRAAFDDFWKRTGTYAFLAGQTKYDWSTSGIDLYEIDSTAKLVYQNFTDANGIGSTAKPYVTVSGAPVAVKIDYEPPRVACLGCNSNVAQAFLDVAGLRDPSTDSAACATGEFVPSDATYCVLNDTDVSNGTLVNGGFGWMWMFGYNDTTPCGNSAEKAVFDKIRDFLTSVPAVRNAGHGIFLDSSIGVAEGCRGKQLLGYAQTTTDGLDMANGSPAEPFILRYPNNLFMQFGDMPISIASGTNKGWNYYKSGSPTIGYQTVFQAVGSSLRRLLTADTTGTSNTLCTQHTASGTCDSFTPTASTGDVLDFVTYGRLGNNLNNGLVYYLPGNQLNNNGNYPELRMLLNSLIALPDESFTTTPTEVEVTRASPVVAPVNSVDHVFIGTYVHQDPAPSIPKATTSSGLARFTFPAQKGHFRAIPVSAFTTVRRLLSAFTGTSLLLFDAGDGASDKIPTASPAGCATYFNGSCRTVFTTTTSGRLPASVKLTTTNVATLGPLMASNLTTTEQQTLISRVLAGVPDGSGGYVSRLGGIDRSTSAVIGVSPLAGSASRPTIAYVGATDGMLHAFCVTTGGGCDAVGRELWAYIPRTNLSLLRQSIAVVNGSPHVVDAYGDFDNTGTKSWRTILMFHTGTGTMTKTTVVPATYAIDITVPNSPKVLWEYSVTDVAPYNATTAPNGRGTYEMGIGLNIVAGTVRINNANSTVAFVQTTNGGTGGAASVLTAIDVETGTKLWQVGDLYPTTSAGLSGRSTSSAQHEAAPSAGVPGGAVGIDTTGNGRITQVVYGDLYGDVFVRSADTGANQQTGTTPLLRISTDYHPIGVPPAIYKVGNTTYAAFTTGGYVDTQSTLWRGTNEATPPTQFLFAVNVGYTGTTIDENNAANVPIKIPFDSNTEGGFAQVMVVGGELFVVTDSTNINDYGYGVGSPTGKVYRYDFGAATPAQESTVVIAGGASSLFNSGTTLMSTTGAYGERTVDAQSTTGTAVDPISASTVTLTRKLWLRTE